MAARPDDDVPDAPNGSLTAADGVERDDAGDTTAALRKPASPATPASASNDALGEDDRTVRRVVDGKQMRAERSRLAPPTPQLGGVQPRDSRPPPVIRMTSKKATAQGLGVPQPLSRRTASIPPPTPPPKAHEADEPDDSSITATAAPSGASIVPSSAALGPVKITRRGEGEGEDEGDETEVRTFVAAFAGLEPSPRPSPSPAAGRPPPAPPPADEGAEAIDDSVTTQAPAIASPADDEPQTQPPILSPAAMSSPGIARLPAKSVDMYETDESVTSRGPAVAEYDEDDDSITAEGPALGRAGKRVPPLPSSAARPGGPGRLVEEADEDDDDEDGDDHPNNQTAVMINAPVKPPSLKPLFTTTPMIASPLAGRAGAAAGEPLSDSGLRIAPAVRTDAGGDHASVGVLLAGVPPSHRFVDADSANPYAPTAPAFSPLDPLPAHPSGEVGLAKKPNYGLIVGVVAGMSVVIPLVLYLSLRGSGPAPEPRTPSEVEPDPVGIADAPRSRAPSTKPPASSTTTRPPWWKKR